MALVKGNCQMRFQFDRATHILWFWLKEVARWDLRLTEKKMKKKREREKKEKRMKRERNRKKKVMSLDEWIFSKLGRQEDKFSLQSLLCKTLRSFLQPSFPPQTGQDTPSLSSQLVFAVSNNIPHGPKSVCRPFLPTANSSSLQRR